MSQQTDNKMKMVRNTGWIFKAVGCACLASFVFIFILSVILWKVQPEEIIVLWGIKIIYALSAFIGGFLAGKWKKKKKFLCGMLIGSVYFLILVMVSVLMNHTIINGSAGILPVLCFCLLGGMLGGMLA